VVAVVYGGANHFVMPKFNIFTVMKVILSFPLRYSAIHVCLRTGMGKNLEPYNPLVKSMLSGLSRYSKVRARIHYGTNMELQYVLQSHGMPTRSCPVDLEGNIRRAVVNSWFEKHKTEIGARNQDGSDPSERTSFDQAVSLEGGGVAAAALSDDLMYAAPAQTASHPSIILPNMTPSDKPTRQDVLLGRGYRTQFHEGNIRFRQFVEGYRHVYDGTPRQQRREFAGNLVRLLHGKGVRFWKKNQDDEWVEGRFEDAEKKVGDLFRSIRRYKPIAVELKTENCEAK